MESLWVGSDVDLSVLHRCRMAERLEYRLSCLSSRKSNKCGSGAGQEERKVSVEEAQVPGEEEVVEECLRRRRRSGTWP